MNLPAGAQAHFTREADRTDKWEAAEKQAESEFRRGLLDLNFLELVTGDEQDALLKALDACYPDRKGSRPLDFPRLVHATIARRATDIVFAEDE